MVAVPSSVAAPVRFPRPPNACVRRFGRSCAGGSISAGPVTGNAIRCRPKGVAPPWPPPCSAPRRNGYHPAGRVGPVRVGTRLFRGMKTFVATPENRTRDWYVVDAEGQTLGRLATQIANALRGKRKPEYTPHCDVGDFVIVVNAEKIAVTGDKLKSKRYYRHSGYPGGIRSRTLEEMLDRKPEDVIRRAVKGMLPRNKMARKQLLKLKVYAGPDHPHAAQQPQPLEVNK